MALVLIIDDHTLMADGLAAALGAEGFATVVAPVESGAELNRLARRYRPDIVLLDLDLGPAGSGLTLIEGLVSLGAQVIVVSATSSRLDFAAAVEAGATGFLAKGQPLTELVAAVHSVGAGQPLLTEDERHGLLGELHAGRDARRRALEPFRRLTPAEQQVLVGLLAGRRAEELAEAGLVAPTTIRTQVRGILTKLGVGSQLEAVAMARRLGWPEPA